MRHVYRQGRGQVRRRATSRSSTELLTPRVLWAGAAGVAVLAMGSVLIAPRFQQPSTGTLVVAVSGKTAGTVAQSALTIHGSGGWVALGKVSGSVPAAPDEREVLDLSVTTGVYDAIRLGTDVQDVSITVTVGQVEPLLLGIDAGRLIPGAAYAGNDDLNLGRGELAGKFVAMPPFDLQDQAGHDFNLTTTAGKDLVIAAFHTSCHETCPLYTALFFQIQQHLPPGVTLAEVTTDPGTDSPAVLAGYANSIGARWTFATGSAAALTTFWKPFGVELATGDVHVSTLALVDRHGYVRLVYRGVPDVGSAIPPALIGTLSAQGLRDLASGGDGWGAPDVLKALLTIAGPQPAVVGSGGKAPDFALSGIDGKKVSLADLAGSPVVINFWASYCPPCRAEMPLLQKRAGPGSGVQLVLVDEGDSRQQARDFLASVGIHEPSLLDFDLSVGRAYGAIALPMTIFVRADGTIAGTQVGQLDDAVLAARLSLLVTQ
ncbi:MAG: redoxin domain-containing protein [Candidatus Dormiibacterota bacterium]